MIIELSNEEVKKITSEMTGHSHLNLLNSININDKLVRNNLNKDAITYHNNYIGYLTQCWATHYGVVFSPHIIWNIVLCELAQRIKDNSEKYRTLFTDSKEKKDIRVLTGDPELIDLKLIEEKLRELVPTNIDPFLPSFSTSTEMSNMAGLAAFCDMVSPYYNYMTYLCAINKIRVEGSVEDWEKFQSHLGQLSEIITGASQYLFNVNKRIGLIIEFLSNPFSPFWEKFFYVERCGSGSEEEIKGWINEFFIKTPSVGFPENYPTNISTIKYTYIPTQKKYKLSYGLFESYLDKDGFLVPDYNWVIHGVES